MRARIKASIQLFFHPPAETRPIQSWNFLFWRDVCCFMYTTSTHIINFSPTPATQPTPRAPPRRISTNFFSEKDSPRNRKSILRPKVFRAHHPPHHQRPTTHTHVADGGNFSPLRLEGWKMLRKNALAFFSCSAQNLFSVCIFRSPEGGEKSRARKKSEESFFGFLMWKKFNFLFWEIFVLVIEMCCELVLVNLKLKIRKRFNWNFMDSISLDFSWNFREILKVFEIPRKRWRTGHFLRVRVIFCIFEPRTTRGKRWPLRSILRWTLSRVRWSRGTPEKLGPGLVPAWSRGSLAGVAREQVPRDRD